jgi:hypothetical protein
MIIVFHLHGQAVLQLLYHEDGKMEALHSSEKLVTTSKHSVIPEESSWYLFLK